MVDRLAAIVSRLGSPHGFGGVDKPSAICRLRLMSASASSGFGSSSKVTVRLSTKLQRLSMPVWTTTDSGQSGELISDWNIVQRRQFRRAASTRTSECLAATSALRPAVGRPPTGLGARSRGLCTMSPVADLWIRQRSYGTCDGTSVIGFTGRPAASVGSGKGGSSFG